jgi:hypothetical protein
MADTSQQMQHLLGQVSASMNELTELERSYEERKTSLIEQVESYLSKISQLSDTQAARAVVLRELYWKHDISMNLLTKAFGINATRVRTIAGSLTVEKPCAGNCGVMLSLTYTSKSALADGKEKRVACAECYERQEREYAARRARLEKEEKERYDHLSRLTWEEYLETKEWLSIRDFILHMADYECEICHDHHCTVYIYPHKDTPMVQMDKYKSGRYFVLCKSCIPRCEDLIAKDRRNVIRQELMGMIVDRRSRGL